MMMMVTVVMVMMMKKMIVVIVMGIIVVVKGELGGDFPAQTAAAVAAAETISDEEGDLVAETGGVRFLGGRGRADAEFEVGQAEAVMDLPEAGFVDGRHGRVGCDVGDDLIEAAAGTRVAHEEHEPERLDEPDPEDAHRHGDGAGEDPIEPDVELDGEEGEEQQQGGAGEGEEV